jgi:hypothetical protein
VMLRIRYTELGIRTKGSRTRTKRLRTRTKRFLTRAKRSRIRTKSLRTHTERLRTRKKGSRIRTKRLRTRTKGSGIRTKRSSTRTERLRTRTRSPHTGIKCVCQRTAVQNCCSATCGRSEMHETPPFQHERPFWIARTPNASGQLEPLAHRLLRTFTEAVTDLHLLLCMIKAQLCAFYAVHLSKIHNRFTVHPYYSGHPQLLYLAYARVEHHMLHIRPSVGQQHIQVAVVRRGLYGDDLRSREPQSALAYLKLRPVLLLLGRKVTCAVGADEPYVGSFGWPWAFARGVGVYRHGADG